MFIMKGSKWILCPTCGGKTRTKIHKNTELKNFPLYCPKCRSATLINLKQGNITIIKEPDAQTQSRKEGFQCNRSHETTETKGSSAEVFAIDDRENGYKNMHRDFFFLYYDINGATDVCYMFFMMH